MYKNSEDVHLRFKEMQIKKYLWNIYEELRDTQKYNI